MQRTNHRASSAASLLVVAMTFVPAYVALDWASYVEPAGPFNITPWNPQPALAIVWMMMSGLLPAPIVFATVVTADFMIRGAPAGWPITLFSSAVLAAGYTATAWALRSTLRYLEIATARDLASFSGIVVAMSAMSGAAFIAIFHFAGLLEGESYLDVWLRFWVGDAVGILVTAPLLLTLMAPAGRMTLARLVRRPDTIMQVLLLVATIGLVLSGASGEPARHFYLLFVPLIWIALRSGFTGAVLATAIVQVAVILEAHRRGASFSYLELQALIAALTLASLFLGIAVDQQRATEERFRNALRLAAAGEMAGAIAHEVNQPLTALENYARSALMLMKQDAGPRVGEMLEKILAEADRASGVVRRLRDFFRTGATQLKAVEMSALLRTAKRIGETAIGESPIRLQVRASEDLPALLIDQLQMEVVLRNLLANAVESLATARERRGHIDIVAARHGDRHVRLSVIDNGPGVPLAHRGHLFQPFASGKPSGMGLGLAVSQAIAEAHGGYLEAVHSDHGEFHLVLPCAQPA